MSLAVPPGQPVNIALSSATFALADNTGKVFGAGETQIPVPSTAVLAAASASATAPPVVTDRAGDGEEVRGAEMDVGGTRGGLCDVAEGNRKDMTSPFSGSRCCLAVFAWLLVARVCGTGAIPAQSQAW
jgi:hypothetical protein